MIWNPFMCGIMLGAILAVIGIMAMIEHTQGKRARLAEKQARKAARNKRLHDLGVRGY